MIILIIFSFIAGVVTILSPCILPILPLVLTSTIGDRKIGKSKPLGVVTGFILSFTFFTLFLSSIVRFSGIPADTLRIFSIFVIAGFGLSLLVPKFQIFLESIFSKIISNVPNNSHRSGFSGGILIGLSIGLLWTPCVGPILASVISLAITGTVTFESFLITLSYSLGTALPMFLIMLGGQNLLRRLPWLLSNLNNIQKLFGVFMVLTAVVIYFNIDRRFQTYMLNTFPQYGSGLTKFEDNEIIRNLLNQNNNNTNNNHSDNSKSNLLNSKGKNAPEIIIGGKWFNSAPLSIKNLKGKVVLIDFWTYSCINCQRTLPYLKDWNSKYKDKGLVIIGVHAPEFEFEKSEKNVAQAISDFNITYPVVLDNDFATWRAYNNRYWPAKYFIDKDGFIRYEHFGEGAYDESEKVIQELLKEAGASNVSQEINNPTYQINAKTPEIYLGYERIDNFVSPEKIIKDSLGNYNKPSNLGNNEMAYDGNWIVTSEYANPQKGAKLFLNFDAKEVYLVMRTNSAEAKVKVYLDDKIQISGDQDNVGIVTIKNDDLYNLIKIQYPGKHSLELQFEDSNAELFAFTFG